MIKYPFLIPHFKNIAIENQKYIFNNLPQHGRLITDPSWTLVYDCLVTKGTICGKISLSLVYQLIDEDNKKALKMVLKELTGYSHVLPLSFTLEQEQKLLKLCPELLLIRKSTSKEMRTQAILSYCQELAALLEKDPEEFKKEFGFAEREIIRRTVGVEGYSIEGTFLETLRSEIAALTQNLAQPPVQRRRGSKR
jgi:hypothetical protein